MVFLLAGCGGGLSTMSSNGWARGELPLEPIQADEILLALEIAPTREGPAPETPNGVPHQQHSQNAPVEMQRVLLASVRDLPGIRIRRTPFSLAGSLGWRLKRSFAEGPEGAFIQQTSEFAHQHRPSDGSMHMLLPVRASAIALEKGWGVFHPLTNYISGDDSDFVMIFGPRNEAELQVIWTIAQISYYQARGLSMDPRSSTAVTPTISLAMIKMM
jgi:phospholipase/carboxylesterase